MKNILVLLLSLVLLQGCSRHHGLEGEYALVMTSSIPEFAEGMQEFMGLMGAGNEVVVIGSNFIERDGIRDEFDRIFLKKSGRSEYLIFEKGETKESWKIKSDGRLVQTSGGLMGYSLVPISNN